MPEEKARHTGRPMESKKEFLFASGAEISHSTMCSIWFGPGSVSDGLDQAIANAARLALCWNCHDELVAVVRDTAEYYRGTDSEIGVAARAALAKVEGPK